MSTKKKMIVSISSMCVVLLVAVVSVIAVWAATSASVKSNISITYTIKNIEGSMKMRIAERSSKTDSEINWTSFKTDGDAGTKIETINFTGAEEDISGAFALDGNFWQSEYSGIQPMAVIEVQMTNSSTTSYFAQLSTDGISYPEGYGELDEVYVVRDFFATGSEIVPKLGQYHASPENFTKEVVGASGFTTTEYEIKNDGVYCFYICIVSNKIPYKNFDTLTSNVNFSIDLHNAYAPEV